MIFRNTETVKQVTEFRAPDTGIGSVLSPFLDMGVAEK